MRVTYIAHSGFAIENENTVFIFDYFKERLPKFSPGCEIYVFSSHGHRDHFNIDIADMLSGYQKVKYILSDDMRFSKNGRYMESIGADIVWIAPDEKKTFSFGEVRTLRSTDTGVAYDVNIKTINGEGLRVFHAGDLNLWTWDKETEEFNSEMSERFYNELEKIRGVSFDIAFLPLDIRQKGSFGEGFNAFFEYADIKKAFPMHFWEDFGAASRFLLFPKTKKYRDKVMIIDKNSQQFEI